MKKQNEDIVAEIRKRQPDKPLSLTELATIREISYIDLKKEKAVLDLLILYCCDSRFQIRVCEKAFLITTVVPLMQSENETDVIKAGTVIIACLSENEETHRKIIKSEALTTLSSLIKKNIHHEITKHCLQTISNLCKIQSNFNKILELEFIPHCIQEQLLVSPTHSQQYLLQIIYQLTLSQHMNLEQMCRLILKKRHIKPIIKCIVSSDIDVATIAILIINNLIINKLNTKDSKFDRLLKLKIPQKLLLTSKLFQNHEDSVKIKKAIMQTLENLLKIKAFQQQFVQDSYFTLCLQMLNSNVLDLHYYGISCIASISELVESHDKLVEKKILELIFHILKENKHQKIREQAFKIISQISLNPKYLQSLINMGMIDLLVNSLNSDEKYCKIYSILSLSNLSCSQNFHKYISNINIKLLIHTLELQDSKESSEDNRHAVLRAAANTLANISIDHNYQLSFLQDPEKTIILKLIYKSRDILLIKSIIIIFTNISTNSNLITEVAQPDILNCLFLLYQRDYDELRGYLSRCLSGLSIVPECRKIIVQNQFMKQLVNSIYKSNRETKRMILLSIMMMLSFSEEFQKQFIAEQGTECLLYLMSQSDDFHAYIAAKSFVLISRMESSLSQIAKKKVCESVAKFSLLREKRILKEGLRFFVNIIIHKRPKAFIIDHLCFLAEEVLQGDEPDAQQLGLFAFMLTSEQQTYHETVMSHEHLLETVAKKASQEIIPQNATFLAIAVMNLSLNTSNLDRLLTYKYVKVMKDLCQQLSKSQEQDTEFEFHTYLFTFIRQLLKIQNLQDKLSEIFTQGITQIIQELVRYGKPYFFRSLLESINILISLPDKYPNDILNVIIHLSNPDYEKDDDFEDQDSLPLRVYVLNRMSYNPASLQYFKQSDIVKFLNEKMTQDRSLQHISQYFCSLLANISKENTILDKIFDVKILDSIFVLRNRDKNIKLTDIIRLLAHLSSHPQFHPKIFTEEIYANIFNHLQSLTQIDKLDPQICYPVLICILNMTKSDYALIQAIARSDIFKFIKKFIKDRKGPKHITILCFLTISNMLIDEHLLQQEQDILDLVNQLRLQIVAVEDSIDLNSADYSIVSFLKVMHNMVLRHYKEVEDTTLMKDCLVDIQRMFIKFQSPEVLALILSIFCVIVESPKTLHQLKTNYSVMIKIFDLLHHNYEKLEQQEQRFRTSLLLLLANLAYYEHSFDFFETFLNIEDFMIKFRSAYLNLQGASDRELLLTILVNLTYIKEIQLIMPKYEKTLQLIKDIFLQDNDDQTIKRIIQLLSNLSLNQDLHQWIATPDLLKRLNKLFYESGSSKNLKEQIQILLANTTFTEEVHEVLIKNQAIKVFEQIINKQETIMQQEAPHYQVVSIVNLGLNPKTYALVENEDPNMINTLDLLEECEKPLQIRLLKAALEYVIADSSQNLSNKKKILQAIISNINFLLETRSKFLVCKIDPLWQMIVSSELINDVKFDKERLVNNFVAIIIHFDTLEIKCNYYSYLCELADKMPQLIEFPSMAQYIKKLFSFDQANLAQLKDLNLQQKQKQQVDSLLIIKYEQLVNQFLRLLSNVAFSQKNLQNLAQFMAQKDLEDHLLEICTLAHTQSPNLIQQSLATYANIFQIDSRNYQLVFEILSKNYKQQIKILPLYQTFLIGIIVGVMKNRKYLLFDENKQDFPDLNDSVQSFQKNPLYSIQQQQSSQIFQKRISSQQTFISIKSESEQFPVNKDMSLIISVLLYVLKRGHPPNFSPASPLLLQCFTNIAYHQENFKYIFSTKLPEYLFTYLQQKENMLVEGYVYAVTSFINISTNREFFYRIQPEEVYKYVVKLNQYSKTLVIQYSSSIFMQMFEYGSETDENQHLVEFTLDFLVNEVLVDVSFDSDYMDQFLLFLERLLKIQKLKYKIAKIESLFTKFQKTLESQDLTNDKKFDKYWKIWNIYNFLIPSKECLNYLVKYGYFNLLKQKLAYFTSNQFEQCLSFQSQLEYIEKLKNVLKQLQLFSIILSSVERIFRTELNFKLQPPIQRLVYSQRNEKISTDIIKINEQDALKISFYIPFLVLEKILLSEETYLNQTNILILVEVLNQIALILTRMDSNGEMTLRFLIDILKRTQRMNIEDKTIFYSNIINIAIKLFEKFGIEISNAIEEILILIINHWQDSDYRFMNAEIYQNFLRICVLFKFKDCQIQKSYNLANSVLQIMIMNQTTFREHEAQLLFQMFLKKLIAEIDPSESQDLEESIQDSVDFLLEYVQKQSANIKTQIDAGDKSVNEYQKTLQQQNFTMTIEILTILVSFTSFQEKILELELLTSTVQCGLLIQDLLDYYESKEFQSEDMKTAINQLQSFIKHISIFLSYTSFIVSFHEELQSQPCVQFIFQNMLKRKKQIKIFCFNIVINLVESSGPSFMFEVLQAIEDTVDEYNNNQLMLKYQLDALISLIEELYQKVQNYRALAPTEDIFSKMSDDIQELLTKALVGKKNTFNLSNTIQILIINTNPQIQIRTFFIINKKYINCDIDNQLRDQLIRISFQTVKRLYCKLSSVEMLECNSENLNKGNNEQFINIKFVWDQIRKNQIVNQLDELFFWEQFDLSELQFDLIYLVMSFENITGRLKGDSQTKNNISNSAQLVYDIFKLLDTNVDNFLNSLNISNQLNFIMIYYCASITYLALASKTRRTEYQQLVEQYTDFRIMLHKFVDIISESKINILANFGDLIKGPVKSL